jgi:hypothetical protein
MSTKSVGVATKAPTLPAAKDAKPFCKKERFFP